MGEIKVMHVLCMRTYSGAENVAITLINSLKGKVNSVYTSPDGPIREVVQQNGIEYYAIEKVDVKNIKKAIKDIKPDVIHAHDFTAGTVCVLAAGNVPIINHLHNNSPWIKHLGIKSIIYGLSCFKYKEILTVSDSVMNEFIFGRFFMKKVVIVGNPVNLTVIREKAEEFLPIQVVDKAKTDIVFLGRLTLSKNIFFFLEILKELKKRKPDLSVSVIGDGELRKEFEEKIHELGLDETVHLFGFQENPYAYLKQAKVMCMPSAWEGFGLAAVESLTLGKPVIAAEVGGLSTIINNSCGKLCINTEDYVLELYQLLTVPSYYSKKSNGALKRADDFDNIKSYADIIENLYLKCVGVK